MTWTLLKYPDSSPRLSLDDPKFREYIEGRLFTLTYKRDGSILNVEATIVKTNPLGLLVTHGRGKVSLLIERDWFVEAQEILPPIVVPKLIVRQLGPVTMETARQHLADRHGVAVAVIPEDAMEAMALHSLHHQNALGHRHGDKKPRRGAPTPELVDERAAELDASDQEECDSCGRLVSGDRDKFKEIGSGESEGLLHCLDCADPDEYTYTTSS